METKATGPMLTQDDIEAEIANEYYFTGSDGVDGAGITALRAKAPTKPVTIVALADGVQIETTPLAALRLVTFCILVLKNGTKVVGINYGPVSPENFSAERGRTEARANAIEQVWPLMGYELRTKLALQAAVPKAPPDCPHAAPHRYCMQCVVSPCPVGLDKN